MSASSNPMPMNPSLRLTVSVDNNHCHLYAICAQEAPEVFDLSIDGRLRYKANPPAHLHDKVWNAARLCPMQAIHLKPATTVGTEAARPKIRRRPAPKHAKKTS